MDSEKTNDGKETQAEGAAAVPADRPLNRAEKRALAHNKGKSGNAGGSGMQRGGSSATGMGRTSARAGNVSLPRTGHK